MVTLDKLELGVLLAYPAYILVKRDKSGTHSDKKTSLLNFIIQSLRVNNSTAKETVNKIISHSTLDIKHDDVVKYTKQFYNFDPIFKVVLTNLQKDFVTIINTSLQSNTDKLIIEYENYLTQCSSIYLRNKCKQYSENAAKFFEDNKKDIVVKNFLLRLKTQSEKNKEIDEIISLSDLPHIYSEEALIHKNFVPSILARLTKKKRCGSKF